MQHFHVITGAPGSGKSRALAELRESGCTGLDEPARQILSEQRSFGGAGVGDRDPGLFTQLLLSRSIFGHTRMQDRSGHIFFDRGVPDVIAYAAHYELDLVPFRAAARVYTYNKRVFVTPDWPEIYHPDDERKMTFAEACRFGESLRRVYQDLGYELVELPRDTPARRAAFMISIVRRAPQA